MMGMAPSSVPQIRSGLRKVNMIQDRPLEWSGRLLAGVEEAG